MKLNNLICCLLPEITQKTRTPYLLAILYSYPTHPPGQYQRGQSQLRYYHCHLHPGLHTLNVHWPLPITQYGPVDGKHIREQIDRNLVFYLPRNSSLNSPWYCYHSFIILAEHILHTITHPPLRPCTWHHDLHAPFALQAHRACHQMYEGEIPQNHLAVTVWLGLSVHYLHISEDKL